MSATLVANDKIFLIGGLFAILWEVQWERLMFVKHIHVQIYCVRGLQERLYCGGLGFHIPAY